MPKQVWNTVHKMISNQTLFVDIWYIIKWKWTSRISMIITHPLISAWFYWLLYVTWYKSPDSYHAITPARVDICPPIVSVEEKHSQHKNFNFSFFYLTWRETKLVLLSPEIVTLKSWWQVLFLLFSSGVVLKRGDLQGFVWELYGFALNTWKMYCYVNKTDLPCFPFVFFAFFTVFEVVLNRF